MKIIIAFVISICVINNSFSQNTYNNLNFRIQEYLLEYGDSEIPLGFFVQGNKQAIINLVEENNGEYRSSVSIWHYVKIPSNRFVSFVKNKAINNYHISLDKGTPLNDTMRVNNRINDIHSGSAPLSSSYLGDGVILGVIDTGLDWTNADFKDSSGNTRIMYLWDQTLPVSSNTPSYGYGQQWDSASINLGAITSNPDQSHGTTVTGCAAGNGLASGTHMGVAPNADIVFVASDFNASDWLSTVVDATEYIYNIADSLGKPCVINASLGTYWGSHDGLDPYALYIDSLITSSSGHLFVCSAGNAGDQEFHLQHNSTVNDTSFTFFEHNPSLNYAPYGCVPYCYGANSVHFVGYADTANFNNVKIAMSAYNGTHKSGTSSYFTIADYLAGNLYQDSYGLYVDSIVNDNNERVALQFVFATLLYGSVYEFEIIVSPDSVTNYLWGFQTTGNGKCDIWSDATTYSKSNMVKSSDLNFPFSTKPYNYIDPDSLQNMCSSFQCSPNTITVANYYNDTGYVNNLGNWVTGSGHRGMLAENSSKGPTRTGLQKPDIAASGHYTLSTCPNGLLSFYHDSVIAYGGAHKVNGGTSMASPVVAGVAALFLEKCNLAKNNDFKHALITNAYSDSWTGTLPNYGFGYGKVDGFATLINRISSNQTSCNSYTWNGNTYTSSGLYVDSLVSSSGCDSIVTLNLTIDSTYQDSIVISSCNSYLWNGNTYTSSGLYVDSLVSSSGCDSITSLYLTIDSTYQDSSVVSSCTSYLWNGNTYTSSGLYIDSLVSNSGCDSIVTLYLTIDSVYNTSISASACSSYLWNGTTYTISGTYIDSLVSNSGCDSIVTLYLTIDSVYNTSISASACSSYLWNGTTYTISGTYIDTLNSSLGCDSIATLNLSIITSSESPLLFTLVLDDYCLETSWELANSSNTVLYSGGPYLCNPNGGGSQANDTILQQVILDTLECYRLTIYDLYGDGLNGAYWGGIDGSWLLEDNLSSVLLSGYGDFGDSIYVEFTLNSIDDVGIITQNNASVSVYPNPFSNSAVISVENISFPYDIHLTDITGRVINSWKDIYSNKYQINNTNTAFGIYYFIVSNEDGNLPIKVVIE